MRFKLSFTTFFLITKNKLYFFNLSVTPSLKFHAVYNVAFTCTVTKFQARNVVTSCLYWISRSTAILVQIKCQYANFNVSPCIFQFNNR